MKTICAAGQRRRVPKDKILEDHRMSVRGYLLCIVMLFPLLAGQRCLAEEAAPAPAPVTAPTAPIDGQLPPVEPAAIPPDDPRSMITFRDYTLHANQIGMNLETRDVYARGDVLITTPEGPFTASSAQYNQGTRSGYLEGVRGNISPFRFYAQSMSLDARNVRHIQNATLSTCTKEHPHYQFRAKDFIVKPDQHFEARHLAMAVAGHTLFSIPRIVGSLGDDSTNIARPTVTAGSSRLDGTFVGLNYLLELGPNTEINATGRVGTEGLARGEASVDHRFSLGKLGGGTLSLIGSHREDIRNRLYDTEDLNDDRLKDLTVSRVPAVQLAMDPIKLTGPVKGFSLRLGAGYGRYHEEPTEVATTRGQYWGILSTPIYTLGSFRLRGEYGLRNALYRDSSHRTYTALLALENDPKASTYFSLSLLHREEAGTSPFLFDRVLVPNELYSELEVPIAGHGRWRLGLLNRHDLKENRSRDMNITAIYKQDCLSYGLSYNTATETIGVGLVLNAFGSFRRGMGSIEFTQ